ncbi:MAG: amidohydrolase family protein, partial [bacterium]|nr:amidohydrolase family protein [bacterium]
MSTRQKRRLPSSSCHVFGADPYLHPELGEFDGFKLATSHRSLYSAIFHAHPRWIGERRFLRDATRALGLGDEIGSLEPGKRADLILLDSNSPHLTPLYDPCSHLVYAAGRGDVSTVMIDGRLVMRDRQLLTVDEGRTIEDVRE